jgi:ribonuclease R
MIKDMADLCQILKRKRVERGALEFDFPEAKAELDAAGRAAGITLRERNTATAIIEEFMVLCNETVAEEFFWLELPFVYRCHEEPDTYRRRRFTEFLKNLGYSLRGKESRSYQTLLLKAKNSPEEAMIGNVMLRSLQQAKYTEINIGHFGLASKCYCHFTSPIRRYPDLQIHRIIKENLCQKLNTERIAHYNEILPDVCKKTSFTERRAQNCERDVLNMKKVEYMSGKIGQEFEGVISGVINRGFFVTLENTSDGMVSVKNMGGDYFVYDEHSITLTGQATGQVFGLGKRVKVKLLHADVEAGKMDFLLV